MHALKTGQVVVLDRILVAQEEGDVDQLFGRDKQARLDDRDRFPHRTAALSRAASSFSPSSPSQTRLGRASAFFPFLAGLAAGAGAAGGGVAAGAVAAAGAASPRALARIMSILLGALAAARPPTRRRRCRKRRPPRLQAAARGLGGLGRSASRASISPIAVRSAEISTVRRSIRSGPRTGMGMSRSTSPRYHGAVGDLLAVDLLLEHDQAVQERLRRGRAARDINVDRHVLVDAGDDVVSFLERAAAAWRRPPSTSHTWARASGRRAGRSWASSSW